MLARNRYETKTYKVDLFCKNCRHKFSAEIQRGVPVWDYCHELECPKCGCQTVGKDMSESFKEVWNETKD